MAEVRYGPSKAVVALSVALIIAVVMCVYLYLYPRGTPPETAIPVTLPMPQPEWVKTVIEVVGGRTYTFVTNICPGCRPELTRTLAKAAVGPWEWSIVRIVEAEYIRYGDEPYIEVYKAREGTRFVIVTARIRCTQVLPTMSIDDFNFSITTSTGREYFFAYGCTDEFVPVNPRCMVRVWNASKELISKALPVYLHFEIPTLPRSIGENDFIFMIPENGKPLKLRLYIRLSNGEEFRGEIPLP
jgi:hypothetical protein